MSPEYLFDLANACILAGELDSALDALRQILAAEPDDLRARRMRAAVLLRLPDERHWRAALADFDALSALTPEETIQRSVVCESLGDPDSAIDAIAQAREEYPANDRLTERYLHLLLLNDRLAEAQAALANLPQGDWRWQQWAGDIAVRQGDDTRAAEQYTAALERLDAHPALLYDGHRQAIKARVLLALGDVYLRQGLVEPAEDCYERAAPLVPDDPMIPFNRGLLAALRGDLTEALALCGEALTGANTALAARMEQTLRSDRRFSTLAALLLMGDTDA